MLEAYALNQSVSAAGLVPFTAVSLRKGETATLEGTTAIHLNRCGVYSVNLTVSGIPATAGDVSIQMQKNGVPQPQATATIADALTSTGGNLSISTLVQVTENNGPCCCKAPTVLQFVNTGVGLAQANTSVTVTKIC